MKKKSAFYFIAAIVVTGVLFFFLGMGSHPERGSAQEASPVSTVIIKDEGGFSNAISRVAEALRPAVVHIDITGTVVQQVPASPFGNDPFFKYFFGPNPETQRKIPIRALGSGVIISKDGYIITNNHVVENAQTITVELFDKTRQKAKLVGRDPKTDLAVIKIKPSTSMRYAKLGDSDKIKVGGWVITIGSPRGFDWTVTSGIVSAKNRSNIGALGPSGYEDFIQTDAAINPGNSGGPLIDLKGEVIGINSLIISTSRGFQGMGFAIPSNMVKTISNSLIKYGKVIRGYLGVSIQDITPEMAKSLGLKIGAKGAIIADVVPGSPADKARIKQGDIIIKYNGKEIDNASMLRNMVAQTHPKTVVSVTVLRDNKKIDLKVKIGQLEKVGKHAKSGGMEAPLGLTVVKVTPNIAKEIGLRRVTGVIVRSVVPGSPGAKVGIEAEDIIFRVGNRQVNSAKDFRALVSRAVKQGGAVLLVRDHKTGQVGYITVPVE